MRHLTKIFNKIPKVLRSLCCLFKTALGIKDNGDGTEDYRSLTFAGWIFLLGIPTGTLLFGVISAEIWFLIVLGLLIMANIDSTIKVFSVLRKTGGAKVTISKTA